MLADRLFDTGHLRPGDRVLVVGAGVAGVTAGVHSVSRGADVRIVEKARLPFPLQRLSDTRHVDPTQYDWPLPHWREGRFPWLLLPEMPLRWARGPASELAVLWTAQLEKARERFGNRLNVLCSTKFLHLKETDPILTKDSVCAVTEGNSGITSDLFEAVLFCHGFGNEITSVAEFSGVPFWSKEDRKTLPSEWTAGATLIAGGGDGALQDFLLEVTGLASARDIFETLFPDGEPEVEREIQAMEDQAHRASLWATPHEEHCVRAEQEALGGRLAARVLERASLRKTLTKLVSPEVPDVTIAHACSHFGRAYALNRFLALLLIQFLASKGATARLTGTFVDLVRSNHGSHICKPDSPDLCFGYSHHAVFRATGCAPEFERQHQGRDYQRVVVRRGVHRTPSITIKRANGAHEAVTLPACRQSLPYYPPEKLPPEKLIVHAD